MKSIVIHAAKDLRIEESEPEALGPGQVEVRIEAGGICGSDLPYFNHGGFGAMKSYSNAVPPNVNIAQHTLQKTADEKRLQTEV